MKNLLAILALLIAMPANAGRSFNGSTDVITANGISTALDIPTGPETVSFWWKPATVSVVQAVVSHFSQGVSGSQFTIGTGFNVGGGADNQIGWQVGCCGSFGPSAGFCSTAITVGQWYQVVMFIDTAGTLFGSPTTGITIGGGISCSSHTSYSTTRSAGQSNFTIGIESNNNFPASGSVGEVAVWNVLLSTSQMTALHTVCPGGGSAKRMGFPSPVGYFPLTGASGSSIEPDLSGNKLNGTLTGTTPANHPPCTP